MRKQVSFALALSMVMTSGMATVANAAADDGKTNVVFWNSWTGGDGETLEALVNKFNEESDTVHVEMTRTTSFSDMLQTSLPTGEAADLVLLSTNEITRYKSYLRSMDDIWENTGLKEEDFSPAYLSMCYNDDTLYAIPFQISTYMMYYNKDLFEQAGLDPESPPTTIEELLEYAAAFIPKIHDWSVNDGFCSTFKIVRKHRAEVWDFLMQYRASESEFEQRVVAVMLMDHFLVPEYIDRVLAVYNSLKHEGYYCKMGVAWGIATAYAKFPQETQAFLLENELDDYTYNKAIQKMLESYRVSAEDKEMLRGRKRKVTGRKNVAKPEQ